MKLISRIKKKIEIFDLFCSDSINLLGIDPEHHILDPCLPLNLKQNISIHFDVKNLINAQEAKSIFKDEADHIMVYAIGTGDWDKCYETMSQFVKSSEPYFLSCSSDDPGCPSKQKYIFFYNFLFTVFAYTFFTFFLCQMLVSKCLPYLWSIRIFTDFLNFGTLQKTLYIWVDYTPMIILPMLPE